MGGREGVKGLVWKFDQRPIVLFPHRDPVARQQSAAIKKKSEAVSRGHYVDGVRLGSDNGPSGYTRLGSQMLLAQRLRLLADAKENYKNLVVVT